MGKRGRVVNRCNHAITLTTGPKPPVRASRRQQLQSALADADRIRGTGRAGQVGGSLAGFVQRIERLPPQNSRAKGSEVSKIGRIDFRYLRMKSLFRRADRSFTPRRLDVVLALLAQSFILHHSKFLSAHSQPLRGGPNYDTRGSVQETHQIRYQAPPVVQPNWPSIASVAILTISHQHDGCPCAFT